MKIPNLFIVGAPRCGTTSMAKYLSQHPDIFMAPGEPHFFGSDIAFSNKVSSEKDYLDLFAKSSNEKWMGEKSTWYLYSRTAAEEIKDYNRDSRILIQIRNPVDMVYSLHRHLLYTTPYPLENISSFEQALDAQGDRMKAFKKASLEGNNEFMEPFFYTQVPLYTEQIKRYVDCFGWNRIHVIVYDDLKTHTLDTYKKILQFLNVDDGFQPAFNVYNRVKGQKSLLFLKIMRKISKYGERIVLFSPPSVTTYLRRARNQFIEWNTVSIPHQSMKPHVRKRLQNEFADEVDKLSKLLDRDLNYWVKDQG